MNKEYTADVTQRFLLLRDEVIQSGECKNKAEFAKMIGEHPQNLSLMEKGTRAPTINHIANACAQYSYSPTWLILNIGQKRLDKTLQLPIEKRLSDLETQFRSLKRLVNTTLKPTKP